MLHFINNFNLKWGLHNHSRTWQGGREKLPHPPSFQDLGKIQIFRAKTKNIWKKSEFFGQQYEKFGQSQKFSGSDNDQLQKQLLKNSLRLKIEKFETDSKISSEDLFLENT